jgi:hypothetical protein
MSTAHRFYFLTDEWKENGRDAPRYGFHRDKEPVSEPSLLQPCPQATRSRAVLPCSTIPCGPQNVSVRPSAHIGRASTDSTRMIKTRFPAPDRFGKTIHAAYVRVAVSTDFLRCHATYGIVSTALTTR